MTSHQRMLTPSKHLILRSLSSRVHITLHSALYFLFWVVTKVNTLLATLFHIIVLQRNQELFSLAPFKLAKHLSKIGLKLNRKFTNRYNIGFHPSFDLPRLASGLIPEFQKSFACIVTIVRLSREAGNIANYLNIY